MHAYGGGVPPRRLVDPAVDWLLVGPALQLGGLGVVAFVVAAAVGRATGSGAATAQILASAYWRKGVQGTLLAVLAQRVVAASGQRRRHPTPDEHAWAEHHVFGGTLPPRERIVLTDTVGLNGRAFTVPEPGGTISVNLGHAAFAAPLDEPALFVHELVHVWQIAHASSEAGWLATAIATQAADLVTHRAYALPPAGRPFRRMNPEQQASVVERWFSDGMQEGHEYFPIVRDVLRRR
jgi:hypothetical protein